MSEAVVEHWGALPDAFSASCDVPRLVLLVSPTCEVCLEGVGVVASALEGYDRRTLALHVLWVNVLDADDLDAAVRSASLVPDRLGARQYWDGDLVLSKGFHGVLDLDRWDRRVAWDLYLLYEAGVCWGDETPTPLSWMHQLRIEEVPSLEGELLVRHLGELVSATGRMARPGAPPTG